MRPDKLFWGELELYAQRFWNRRREFLGNCGEEAERVLKGCSGEEKLLLQYVLATLPLSDLGDYPPGLFLNFVREALKARKQFSWCRSLPEHLFLKDVLYPRINTEELSDCRGIFYQALADRVNGLPLEQAVLEVNRWCAEHVTYRSTDGRTASPLAVYQCGYGRCGEESTFAVSALRSVGIAARQIYVPWWSHCDDNHAWVEVWDGKSWRYLGACEPEPELDRGWFTAAASRAMMVHTRAFAQGNREDIAFLFPGVDPVDLELEDGVACETVTQRYASTRQVHVALRGEDGRPVSGVWVRFSVLNMGSFRQITSRKTGVDGSVSIRLGLGSVLIGAEGGYQDILLDVSKETWVQLSPALNRACKKKDFDFLAPAGAAEYPPLLSQKAKEERRRVLKRCAFLREEKQRLQKAVPQPEGNWGRIFNTLTEKDRAGGLSPEVLEDAEPAFAFEREYPQEVFEPFLLCPRIGLEPLKPWRRLLFSSFSALERETFRAEPWKLWLWETGKLTGEPGIRTVSGYEALEATPAGMFQMKAASPMGRRILFCALCRSLGIPARLSPLDGKPEYWAKGGFHKADRPAEGSQGAIELLAPSGQDALSQQNYGLCWAQENLAPLGTEDIPAGERRKLYVDRGSYRLISTVRLPNGNQLARQLEFQVEAGKIQREMLVFREGDEKDLLERLALPPFTLYDRDGESSPSAGVFQQTPVSLLVWLEPGREPTEHILNELFDAAERFNRLESCGVHFILRDWEETRSPVLKQVAAAFPNAQVWQGDFSDETEILARRMYVEPDRFPLALLADRKGNGRYACAGYRVGTVQLILRMLDTFF